MPLIFTGPGTGFGRRCVTEEVRNSALVFKYIQQQIIKDENEQVVVPAKPVEVETPEVTKPVETSVTEEPAVLSTEVEVTPEVATPENLEAPVVVDTTEATASTEDSSKTDNRNWKKRGR